MPKLTVAHGIPVRGRVLMPSQAGGTQMRYSYTGKDGITHVIMLNGDHYAGRNGNYAKVR